MCKTDEEADLWESIYEKDGDIYRLQVTSRSELNEIDDTLAVPLIMNYQMSAMEDSAVKEHVAKPTGADAGTLEKDTLLSMRDSMEETIDTMGSSLVKSMGAAYAVSCDKAAGIDVENLSISALENPTTCLNTFSLNVLPMPAPTREAKKPTKTVTIPIISAMPTIFSPAVTR